MNLKFKDPIFRLREENLTVRRGTYWNTLNFPLDVNLVNSSISTHYHKVGEATVTRCVAMRLIDIPEAWLKKEHAPSCRTMKGLIRAMEEVYGEDFNAKEIVTLMFFTVTKIGAQFVEEERTRFTRAEG